MCGIAAMLGLGGRAADAPTLERMAETIRHRGPDDEGLYLSGPVGFAFRRLAILDLAPTGHQPMVSPDGQSVIVFNGEIYNYVELRHELSALGHVFVSSGDTEVLLAAYRQWGRGCLPKLNGMWAFLIYDARARTLFGSRDRFGVKPLYRYRGVDGIYFASEIKAIRASGRYRGGPNWPRISTFLLSPQVEQLTTAGQTFYRDVEEVPAGSGFEITLHGRSKEWRFWTLADQVAAPPADPPEAFYGLFEDAVRLRMRSDVPVGVSLSGGLDSTAVVSVMSRLRRAARAAAPDNGLQAFSYVAPEFDESRFIADTIRETGATYHQVEGDARRLWESLDRVLWYQDEPVHSLNALVSFDIFGLAAANGIKVMLTGTGADESIAGYSSYFPDYWYTLLARGKAVEAWREITRYCDAHGGEPRAIYRDSLTHVCRAQLGRIPAYRRLADLRRRRRLGGSSWFTPELRRELPPERPDYHGHALDDSLRHSVQRAPLPFYLRVEDRNSMAHSVEARAPFLDYRLVTLAFALPASWKIRGPFNKYVLREALRGRIPESVRARVDKMGFPVPLRKWVRGPLYQPFRELLSGADVRTRGVYEPAAILGDLERHRSGEIDAAIALLRVAQLESWFRVAGDSSGSVATSPPSEASQPSLTSARAPLLPSA